MKSISIYLTPVLVLLTACANHRSDERQGFTYSFSVKDILASDLPKDAAAEKLAEGAEQLMNAKAFDQADQVATKALTTDPNNLRAGLIKGLLGPLLLHKGLIPRLKPLADRSPTLRKTWASYADDMMTKPDERFNSWYLAPGGTPIVTEKDLQAFVDKEIAELESFRIFLANHRDAQITMIASPLFVPDMNARYAERCEINETPDLSFTLKCPPATARRQVALNRADFETLLGGVVYYEISLAFPNAYDMTGLVGALKDVTEVNPAEKQIVANRLAAITDFGKLRLPNSLTKIRGWSIDFMDGLNWSVAHKDLSCPKGENDKSNRPGFFYNQGFCLAIGFADILPTANQAVKTAGPVPFADKDVTKGQVFQVAVFAPMERPMPKLTPLFPLKFNDCGNLEQTGDATLGGVFPNQDANSFLKVSSRCED